MRLIDADKLRRVMRNTSLGPRHLIDYCIDAAPTIEPPAPDRVLASDVVKGLVCHWKNGYEFTVGNVANNYADITDGPGLFELPCEMVADMLQGCLDRGERVDWPDGSPGCRFRKEEEEEEVAFDSMVDIDLLINAWSTEQSIYGTHQDTYQKLGFAINKALAWRDMIQREKAKKGEPK